MHPEPVQRIDANGAPMAISPNDAGQRAALLEGETLHRAFRPDLDADYASQLGRMFAEGAHIVQLVDGGAVRALAVWRAFQTTYCGRRFEVDDLVTEESHRSRGYGATVLQRLEETARGLGCPTLTLVSATPRTRAHRFYHREGYAILGFFFAKQL